MLFLGAKHVRLSVVLSVCLWVVTQKAPIYFK